MKLIIVLLVCAVSIEIVSSSNVTDDKAQNKTKRGLLDQTHNYGEQSGFKPVNLYHDQVTAAATPGLGHYYSQTPKPILFPNPVFEPEVPKQVTAQQVLYEYQQTPHNAVSNVHVNQQFQTLPDYRPETADLKPPSPEAAHTQRVYSSQPPANPPPNQHYVNQPHNLRPEPNQFNVNPESVVLPVHHSTFVHHGQPQTHLYPVPQNQQIVANNAPLPQPHHQAQPQQPYGKYIYLNGKIVYHPLHPQSALYQQQQAPYPGVQVKHPALSYTNQYQHPGQQNRPAPKPQQLFQAAPVKFINHPNPRRPLITTTTLPPPPPPKVREREEEEEEEKADVREEEAEEEEEEKESEDRPARYETEEEEEEEEEPDRKPYRPFSKYLYDDEEEDDHEGYKKDEEEEEDDNGEDNKRGSSKKVYRKPYSKKYYRNDPKPYRYSSNDGYKYREGYRSKSKYGKPYEYYEHDNNSYGSNKKSKGHKNKDGKEPSTQYKAFKYVKASKAKPKADTLEGRQSQNVPVIHSQKLYKEKWYVSKSKDI